MASPGEVDYDVIIVGAGISGINYAYRLQENNPDLSYCIVDGRHEMGGTWSLFKYPGIRSDSDLFTFGFAWRPWHHKESIAKGPLIVSYLNDCAAEYGIDKKIRFNHYVDELQWSTPDKTWTLKITADKTTKLSLRTRFVLLGTGYYDYTQPLQSAIPGIETFKGAVVHPQFWPEDLDYKDKQVVIVGSGATAITLLPSMAQEAKHVTMLQRSPGYVLSVPGEDALEWGIRKLLPAAIAGKLIRFKWIATGLLLTRLSRRFPQMMRKVFRFATAKQLPKDMELDPTFNPVYAPFEQRMCLSPQGDFYHCLRNGSGSISTGIIDTVTADSIKLNSGEELHPDIIVTATGLRLQFAGGAKVSVDGKPLHLPDHFVWKGFMIEDLPNLTFVLGYVDASWTLGADATATMSCRLLSTMKKEGASMIVPRRSDEERKNMKELPLLNLTSTYVNRGAASLPKTGDRPQWQPRSYYFKDLAMAKFGDIRTGMEWVRGV